MADRPILFSGPMIRALLAGRKTQTRRTLPIAPEIQGRILDFQKVGIDREGRAVFEMKDADGHHIYIPAGRHLQSPQFTTRIGVGDRLYVREHWRVQAIFDHYSPVYSHKGSPVLRQKDVALRYVADLPAGSPGWLGKQRQAMHMPRWASRLTLTVTDVRIERLQTISAADAIAEGIEPVYDYRSPGETHWKDYATCGDGTPHPHAVVPFISPVASYRSLWNEINGARSWEANPWIVAYSFSVALGNIDEVAA